MKKTMRELPQDITNLDELESYNAETERLVCEAFKNGPIAKLYEREFEYILGQLVSRMRALKNGEKPEAIGGYDADTLIRLLSADTVISYPIAEFDAQNECVNDSIIGETRTKESRQQSDLIVAFLEYATAGAIYAKHINSTSVRLWARLMDKLQKIQSRYSSRCFDNEADNLVVLEGIAVDRLRRDMIIAELPPFKKTRAKGRR